MIYRYTCESCKRTFDQNLAMGNASAPLNNPCPNCGKSGYIYRDYSSVSLSYDLVDVRTRCKRAVGSDFGELLKRIHKGAGRNSTMQI